MADIKVPFSGESRERAKELLAAAVALDLGRDVVRVTNGAFVVPQEVAEKAGYVKPKDSESGKTKKSAAKKPAPSKE